MSRCQGERIARELISDAGLEIVRLGFTGKCHIKASVRSSDGRTKNFIFPNSASDVRSRQNNLSMLRRFVREQPTERQI